MWDDVVERPTTARAVNRRGFVGGAVGTGFAAAVMPVVAPRPIGRLLPE